MIAYATSRAYYISYVLYFPYITYTEHYAGKDFKYFSEKRCFVRKKTSLL